MTAQIVSRYLAKDTVTGRMFLKMRRGKTEELQKGASDDERFDRE